MKKELQPYVDAGLTLIPLHKYDHRDERGRERGKSPRDSRWQRQYYDARAVAGNAERDGTNVGVRLDATWVVLDVDPRNFPAGRDVLGDLDLEIDLALDKAPYTITGSGGAHYWFRKPADVDLLDSLHDFPGIEFKSRGRQVVAAGSRHPNGQYYAWAGGPRLRDAPQAPAGLVALARRPPPRDATGTLGDLTPEMLARALEYLHPEDFAQHDKWIELMMACHHATAGEGRQEFTDWSTGDPAYSTHAWQIGRRWDSLHLDQGNRRPITSRLIAKYVLAAGGQMPRTDPEEDFEKVEEHDELPLPGALLTTGDADKAGPLERLNAKHCVVMEGGKFRIFTEAFDPTLNRAYFTRSTKWDFEDSYGNRRVEGGDGKAMTLGRWWLEHPNRRQYAGVVFDPEKQHPGMLNLWKGWAVEPKRGDWSLLRELLREVLCDGDAASERYVLDWAAYMVQHPSRQAETAICFRGEKGTGKGTFARTLVGLAGAHGLHISSPAHLTGRFNSHLKDTICLFADEAFWAGDKAGESMLKAIVTEPTIVFEGKGRDAEAGRNLIHIIMASNNDWVVPAGLDGERRFGVFQVNNKAQGDAERFRAIHRQLDDGGRAALLYDLLTRDIKSWSPRDGVPQTSALAEQKLRSMDDYEAWWHDRLVAGHLNGSRTDWEDGPTVILKAFLYQDYVAFARGMGIRRPRTPTELGAMLSKLVPGIRSHQVTRSDDEGQVPAEKHGRSYAYTLPSLAECRVAFEKRLGGSLRWGSAPEDANQDVAHEQEDKDGGQAQPAG